MRLDFRERGYNSEWTALAAEYKRTHPVCLSCWSVGITQPTEIVDHIEPLSNNKERLLDPTNLQPACAWCHSVIKRALEVGWRCGRLPLWALRLDSPQATKLMRERYRVPVGVDGYHLFELGEPKGPYPYNH